MGQRKDKESANDHALFLRRAKAIELRVKGKKTIREIAKELDVSVGTAHNDVAWMIDAETGQLGDIVKTGRELESQRLDELLKITMTALEQARDVDDQAKLVANALKISERRAKLLGLDAPIRQEIETTINGEATPSAARDLMKRFFASDVTPDKLATADDDSN